MQIDVRQRRAARNLKREVRRNRAGLFRSPAVGRIGRLDESGRVREVFFGCSISANTRCWSGVTYLLRGGWTQPTDGDTARHTQETRLMPDTFCL